MKDFTIVAGACSIDEKNIEEAIEIGKIPEVDGIRCVGLKSVTSPRPFMGIDADNYFEGANYNPPSVDLALRIIKETGKFVAFEMMDIEQLQAFFMKEGVYGKLFIWNPAINQLGYPIYRAAEIAAENGWKIGVKNPKWLGDPETKIGFQQEKDGATVEIEVSNGEKVWYGNGKFAEKGGVKPVMIHRGFEMPKKGAYRNPPVHDAARKMKALGFEVYLDPSHIFGSEMREKIVLHTLDALEKKAWDGSFLYTGLLIEVGTSQTDTGQHISIDELKTIIAGVKEYRGL